MTAPLARILGVAVAVGAAACHPTTSPGCQEKGSAGDLRLTLCSEPAMPYAREEVRYRLIVRDRESGQPIENGEGRIFATSRDGVNRWDVFVAGEELGTYYAELRYLTAGTWAAAIQFRRDSTLPLERVDWMQDVLPSREAAFPGDTT
jgi:hypothetical protein